MHPVVKGIFKTFVISTVLACIVNSALYAYQMQGIAFDHVPAVIRICVATSILTVVLLILSLPALFLLRDRFWKPAIIGFLLYFTGPALYIAAFVVVKMDPTGQLFGQLTGLIYIAITTFFYYFITRDYRRKHGPARSLSLRDRLSSRIDPSN